ncbi:MAG: glutamyl-tRNA amidotransferase [Candidatus Tagabacteria bacterium CG09_land_8_20_14_0_10_41_14]|uniref:Glutamyl-tRNA amidotransferase n=2 Tax=Candidatus Tagaibacteriota TaxID=1817918 RepID=A0A2H0WKR0_9BACT|nr:MAG: glutamyl-tRNA amidotransferase [Candidatus Tagabacteria bacterium CG09_land_8_20_14_0_10_41_14]PJE73273.1 MAG: glutamyl-tRNA amidotransferase [Candidatus Tagabacteria bacterium CG10_big_fil_rev_8_21_14_0_10_40_13]
MDLKEKIQNELKESLKKREQKKVSTLKLLLASIINAEIQFGKKEEGLKQEEIERIIKAEAKKRHEAIEAYEKAGRKEAAKEEEEELSILETYLPEQLSNEEIKKLAKETVTEMSGETDFGKIMKEVMAKTKGRADGKKVSEAVKHFIKSREH